MCPHNGQGCGLPTRWKAEEGRICLESIAPREPGELNVSLIAETLPEVMVVQEITHGYTEPTQVRMRCFGADYKNEIIANSEIKAIA